MKSPSVQTMRAGAFGTAVAAHETVRPQITSNSAHRFLSRPDSTRLTTRRRHNVYNTCGLDMLYFDGSEGMRSRYGIDTMRWKIFQRLQPAA